MTISQLRAQDQESLLDQGIRDLLGQGPEDYTPDEWMSLREQMRLQVLHPGQWVAFRDHHKRAQDVRWLAQREVLCCANTLDELHKAMDALNLHAEKDVKLVDVSALPQS